MKAPKTNPRLPSLQKFSSIPILRLRDLEEGDLLFAINADTQAPVHVAIVSAKSDTGAVRQLHQVEDHGFQGLHENDVVPEGIVVVRCNVEGLGRTAAAYARRWATVPAPYSSLRAGIAKQHEKTLGSPENLVAVHRALFAKVGKFRAIKYAARRNGTLVTVGERPSVPGNKGMFCSMFVAVCYQVAGLERFVEPAPETMLVSDKRMLPKDLAKYREQAKGHVEEQDLMEFESYLAQLHQPDPYELDTDNTRFKAKNQNRKQPQKLFRTKSRPSLEFWKGGKVAQFAFAQCLTEGMMLDAKVIYPEGLLACLRADKKGWTERGILAGERTFSEDKTAKIERMNERQALIKSLYSGH